MSINYSNSNRGTYFAWLLLVALGFGQTAFAQGKYFRFKPTSISDVTGVPYAALSGLNVGTNTITLGDEDESLSTEQPIGFNFSYNGSTLTHFILSTNGFVKLGTAGMAPPTSTYSASDGVAVYGDRIVEAATAIYSQDPLDNNILSPFNMDLEPGTGAIDHFTYTTVGSAPNRICTIQWKEMRDFNPTAAQVVYGQINFQIKLYETSNLIEFVYGTFTASVNVTGSRIAAVGIKGEAPDGVDTEAHMLWQMKGSTSPQGAWAGVFTNPPSTAGALATNAKGVRVRPVITAFTGNGAQAYCFNHRANTLPVSGHKYRYTPETTSNFAFAPVTSSFSLGTYTDLGVTGSPVTFPNLVTDNNSTAPVGIGFNFNYNGTNFTDFVPNNNGFIRLGTVGAPINLFGNADGTGPSRTQLANTDNILYPFNFDLTNGTLTPEVRVFSSGGVCTIQYKNFRDVSSAVSDGGAAAQIYNNIEFQIKLYQATGQIEFIYGNFAPNTALAANQTTKTLNVGIRGSNDLPIQNIVVRKGGGLTSTYSATSFSNISLNAYGFLGANFLINRTVGVPVGYTLTFERAFANDLKLQELYTLGKVAQPGLPLVTRVAVTNVGTNDITSASIQASLSMSGVNTIGSTLSTTVISNIEIGETQILTFPAINPSNNGVSTLTVSVPSDGNNSNNSKTLSQTTAPTTYSYKYAGAPNTGGVGFNGATGNFVAKFESSSANNINQVKVDFGPNSAAGAPYKIAIWGNNAGQPGNLLYETSVLTVVGPNTVASFSICPAVNVSGTYFVGLRQTSNTNIGFGYQTEAPVRSGNFYFNSPLALGGGAINSPTSGWTDFSAGADFRLSLEVELESIGASPACAVNVSPVPSATDQSTATQLNWSAGANDVSYDVYFGSSPTPPLVASNTCATTFNPGGLNPNGTYYWRVVGRNANGSSAGCSTWSFTVAPLPTNDNCVTFVNLVACAATATNGSTVNSTNSLPSINCGGVDNANDDVWYRFAATSSTQRITVIPTTPGFDPVIDLRTAGNCVSSSNINCSNIRGPGQAEELLAAVTPGTNYYVRVYGAGGPGTEGLFTIKIISDGGWTGLASNDWASPGNWCDATVPGPNSNAIVKAGTPNDPRVFASTEVNNLTLDEGSVLYINPSVTLDVRRNNLSAGGNLAGTGSILDAGTLRMINAGSLTSQAIANFPTVTKISLENVDGGISLGGGAGLEVLESAVLLPAAKLANAGTILFASTPAKTAFISEIPTPANYTGAGTFYVERYVATPASRWAFIGSPTVNATLSQFNIFLNTVILPQNNASVFGYDETDASFTYDPITLDTVEKNGWRIPTSLGGLVNPSGTLKGYRAWARKSPAPFANFYGGVFASQGLPYVGDVAAPLTFTSGQYEGGGWNLISNPYASSINWNNVVVPGAVNDAVFVWNGTTYGAYTKGGGADFGVGVNGVSQFIPSSQAFFVKTTAAASITFQENDKVATSHSFIRDAAPVNQLRFSLANAAGESDENVIYFSDLSTTGMDLRGDAAKLDGEVIDLATVLPNGQRLAINGLPMPSATSTTIVPLQVKGYRNGAFTLRFGQLDSFEPSFRISLRDNLLGTTTDIRSTANYAFTISGNPASQGRRFEIIFNGSITSNAKNIAKLNLNVWPNPTATGEVNFAIPGIKAGKATVSVIDMMGRSISSEVVTLDGNAETNYKLTNKLAGGQYTLRIANATEVLTKSITVR